MDRTPVCRNGPNCKFLKENRYRFRHVTEINKLEIPEVVFRNTEKEKAPFKPVFRPPVKKDEEKEIGGFPVSCLKETARSSMNDEEYNEFERAIEKGAPEHVIVLMMYTADQRNERRKKEMTLSTMNDEGTF